MLAARPASECVSDLALDELLGDSAEPGERAQVLEHLGACVRCGVRLELLATQRTAYLERMPSWQALDAQQQAARAARRPPARRWLLAGGVVSIATAAAALLLWASPGTEPPLSMRSKGGPSIGAYIKRGERVTRAEDGSRVRPGDYVRFTYSSDRPVHFALLNRDALRATTYFPEGAQTVRVNAGHDVALDFSIKLDEQAGQEQVFGVFCERPEQLEPLRAALEASGRLPALPDCRVDRLTLDKSSE